jgi:hypothetical protein
MMPNHLGMVRSLCRVRASFGGGLAHAMATLRFSPKRGSGLPQLLEQKIAELPGRKGLTAAHLLQSAPMPAGQTEEQRIRGNDQAADWVLLVNGYDLEAVRAAASELSPAALEGQGAKPGAVAGLYRLAYSAIARDFQ